MSGVGGWCKAWAERRLRDTAGTPRARVALGSLLALLAVAEVVARSGTTGSDVVSTLAIGLLAVGTTLPLAFLGSEAAALTGVATAMLSLAGFDILSAASAVAVLIALFQLGRQSRGLFQVLSVALAAPFLVLALAGPSPSSSEWAALTEVLAVLAPIAAIGGIAVQARREAQENRAARRVIADTLIEHTARSERARIARELHDVVAHHISMVAVQAESARLAVPGIPPAGAQRLSAIADTARAALIEMRRLLGVLREDAPSSLADRHPQPGLDQVAELIDEARETSQCATRLILRGTPIPLDPHVELVAYRLVQEALSNTRRHAPGAAVDVELTYDISELRLRVRDNGPGPSPMAPPGGHGLVGMQERASTVDGTVCSGAARGGGYVVEAVLPAKLEAEA